MGVLRIDWPSRLLPIPPLLLLLLLLRPGTLPVEELGGVSANDNPLKGAKSSPRVPSRALLRLLLRCANNPLAKLLERPLLTPDPVLKPLCPGLPVFVAEEEEKL